MIQRLQSVYLFLAALCFGGEFVTDFATSSVAIPNLFGDMKYEVQDHVVLMALTVLGIVVSIGAIFLYQNRVSQLKVILLSIITSILLPILAVFLVFNERTAWDGQGTIAESVGIFLPVVSLIFGILAYRNTKKDENLVRSMDRLR